MSGQHAALFPAPSVDVTLGCACDAADVGRLTTDMRLNGAPCYWIY